VTPFSPAVLVHVRTNAPALAGGVLDYDRLLSEDLATLDFYDSRRHRAALTGSDMRCRIRARAGALAARGLGHGDRVVMVATNDEQYVTTLLAVLLLGAVPCAVAAPPTPSREDSAGVRHLRAAIRVVNPTMVLGPAAAAAAVSHPGLLDYQECQAAQPFSDIPPPPPRSDDLHHIQLTSGSTSDPKAVALTHRNVAHNLGVLAHGMGVRRGRDRMFSWLPMYHDMGLIQVLGGLLYGLPVALMTPLGFLRDPLSWARHMSGHGSTVTAGPTFAYRGAADALRRSVGDTTEIELSALRHAFVGAEPIDGGTLRYFTDSFAPFGLSADALVPCYGMAESVLATTLALRSAPEEPGNFGRVRTVAADDVHPAVVSCGPAVDGMRVAVVDSDGAEVSCGVIGDIRISGASVMVGYLGADGALQRPPGGWHDTGDRGFLRDGELFVVGRSKEMLIIRGRNLPPYDVERTLGELPEVGPGQAVVFCTPDADRGRERVVAVLATGVNDPQRRRQIQDEAAARVRQVFGFSLDDVVLVAKTSIPRTTSGKIQRLAVRERYASTSICLDQHLTVSTSSSATAPRWPDPAR